MCSHDKMSQPELDWVDRTKVKGGASDASLFGPALTGLGPARDQRISDVFLSTSSSTTTSS